MIQNKPKISIVIPSFNLARFLPQTLDSILAQDYRPLEIIIADGASTDGTTDILRRYAARHPEIVWQSEPDKGPADAINKGLKLATGEIIGIQSADDLYHSGAFSAVCGHFQQNPDSGFVYGDVEGVDAEGKVTYVRRMPDFSWEAFFGVSCSLPQSSVFFRRSLSEQVGPWNSAYYGCDLDYWLRLCMRTRAVHLPLVLSAWRRYPEQRTRQDQFRRIWEDYWRMIDDSEDLRQASPRIRRLARASRHLFALRIHPDPGGWKARGHVLIGFFMHPGFWRYNPPAMIARVIPGGELLKPVYRFLKSLFSGKPAQGTTGNP